MNEMAFKMKYKGLFLSMYAGLVNKRMWDLLPLSKIFS